VSSAGGSFGLSFGLAFAGAVLLGALSIGFTSMAQSSTVLSKADAGGGVPRAPRTGRRRLLTAVPATGLGDHGGAAAGHVGLRRVQPSMPIHAPEKSSLPPSWS
jgi:hypothetical protein